MLALILSILISHHQGLVQVAAYNWGLWEYNHLTYGHVPLLFSSFRSVNADKAEGRGKETILDPAYSTFISDDASAAHS